MSINISTCKTIFNYIKLNMKSAGIPNSNTLPYGYSGLIFCLSINSHSNNEKLGSCYLPSIFFNGSIPVFLNNNIRIVHPYLCSKQPFELEYSAYMQSLLPLVLCTPLISIVTQVTTLPIPTSVKL